MNGGKRAELPRIVKLHKKVEHTCNFNMEESKNKKEIFEKNSGQDFSKINDRHEITDAGSSEDRLNDSKANQNETNQQQKQNIST